MLALHGGMMGRIRMVKECDVMSELERRLEERRQAMLGSRVVKVPEVGGVPDQSAGPTEDPSPEGNQKAKCSSEVSVLGRVRTNKGVVAEVEYREPLPERDPPLLKDVDEEGERLKRPPGQERSKVPRCLWCKSQIVPGDTRNRVRKYCCPRCRVAAHRHRKKVAAGGTKGLPKQVQGPGNKKPKSKKEVLGGTHHPGQGS